MIPNRAALIGILSVLRAGLLWEYPLREKGYGSIVPATAARLGWRRAALDGAGAAAGRWV